MRQEPTMEDRNDIRRKIRTRRRSLSHSTRTKMARQLAQHLAQTSIFRSSRNIACYLPNDGEMDTAPIIQNIRAANKKCYLPMLRKPYHDRMWFVPYRKDDKLTNNIFGIPEPAANFRERISLLHLDLVITPLVAFDLAGNRLGMGGGFYDKTFSFLKNRQFWRKPRLFGIAYEFQQIEKLEPHPWDVPLDEILTEVERYKISSYE